MPPAADRSQIIEQGVLLAANMQMRFEGFSAEPYLCPAGVPTIGFGSTTYLDGRPVLLTDPPITMEAARHLLLESNWRRYLPGLLRKCPKLDDPGEIAALLDFIYNLGEGALATSTLRRKVNAEQWDQVPAQLRRWVFAAGKKLRGLVLRREAEIEVLP